MTITNPLSPKIIYIYTKPTAPGKVKVGETKVVCQDPQNPTKEEMKTAAEKRIRQQAQTYMGEFTLEHCELAVRTKQNGKKTTFTDHKVHDVLTASGIGRIRYHGQLTEWFTTDVQTVRNAILAVKQFRVRLNSHEQTSDSDTIILRTEQDEAVKKTRTALQNVRKKEQKQQPVPPNKRRMLWNAKMRFGKTLSSLTVVKEEQLKHTLILTHRPTVAKGWKEDFDKLFQGTHYQFTCSEELAKQLVNRNNFPTNAEYKHALKQYGLLHGLNQNNTHIIHFISIQDLRGSTRIGGDHNKNEEIFDRFWDLVIVDEAHEGTQTGLANRMFDELNTTFSLALSGTPFNIFGDYDDDMIYTWDYVMEQQSKENWESQNPTTDNPYEQLPKLSILTYALGDIFAQNQYVDIATKSFNFREFFRVHEPSAENPEVEGTFVHLDDVNQFLDLISGMHRNNDTNFPFTRQFRKQLRHSFWLLPGVKEAYALSKLLQSHPVFENYNIANVAGKGDADNDVDNALKLVEQCITDTPQNTRSITLSVGRLTTGVNIPEWTSVLMLANTSSPITYLQTAFRVQTPFTDPQGNIKTSCYVFDFAPERALTMAAEVGEIDKAAGAINSPEQIAYIRQLLNFLPIISMTGGLMKTIDVNQMLRELKSAAIERVARNGFDDVKLYNDELLRMDGMQLQQFNDLKAIIGQSDPSAKKLKIDVNLTGMGDEEFDRHQNNRPTRKPTKELTEEEIAERDRLRQLKQQRRKCISILRGISIRIPIMIYGAEIPYDEEITIDNFTEMIDDASWQEFMPTGVTKEKFNTFKRYYDESIFIGAGLNIRAKIRAADELPTQTERIRKLADVIKGFRNPDKETVLTPWRIVNQQLGRTLGGLVFFDKEYVYPLHDGEEPRDATQPYFNNDSFFKADEPRTVLEINSKAGLYALLVCYNLYHQRSKQWMAQHNRNFIEEEHRTALWDDIIANHLYVVTKTPMAKSITKRTLFGYRNITKHNIITLENLTGLPTDEVIEHLRTAFGDSMVLDKLDLMMGNPPYQKGDAGDNQQGATQIYQDFINLGRTLEPKYMSMITPSRWFSDKENKKFRATMLEENKLRIIHDFENPKLCFPTVSIKGGVNYFLWDRDNPGDCQFSQHTSQRDFSTVTRNLDPFGNGLVLRENNTLLLSIYLKVHPPGRSSRSLEEIVSSSKPFGLRTYVGGEDSDSDLQQPIRFFRNQNTFNGHGWIEQKDITKRPHWIPLHKVFVPYAVGEGMTTKDHVKPLYASPNSACSETYLVVGTVDYTKGPQRGSIQTQLHTEEEARNLMSYFNTRFLHLFLGLKKSTQHTTKTYYTFVPLQSWDEAWDDARLAHMYGFTRKERDYLNSAVWPNSPPSC